jgi:hypothetical protein
MRAAAVVATTAGSGEGAHPLSLPEVQAVVCRVSVEVGGC